MHNGMLANSFGGAAKKEETDNENGMNERNKKKTIICTCTKQIYSYVSAGEICAMSTC